jgi:hypothetical protein
MPKVSSRESLHATLSHSRGQVSDNQEEQVDAAASAGYQGSERDRESESRAWIRTQPAIVERWRQAAAKKHSEAGERKFHV